MSDKDEGPKPDEVAEMLLSELSLVALADTDEVLSYDGGVYTFGAEAVLAEKIEAGFQELGKAEKSTNNFTKEVLGHIRRRRYVKRDLFDRDPFLINLKNGLLDLRTFEVKAHTSEYHSLVQLPIEYNPTADCPKNKKFLSEVTYPEDIPCLQEMVGSLLWRENRIQQALLLIGSGSNGKTTFINTIKALLGTENIVARSLQDLEQNRFARADLFGKLANLYPDLPDSALKSVGTFKSLTGNDPITCEKKFQHSFTYTPYCKLIFSCNKPPEVYEDSKAFFRRWVLISFPNSFEGPTDNRNLLQELTTPEELSGFLNWAIEGLKRLQSQGWHFSYSKSADEVRKEYIRKSSPVKAFLEYACLKDTGLYAVKSELYRSFIEYCIKNKLPTISKPSFFLKLPQFAPEITTSQHTINGRKGVWCYEGIAVKAKEKWDEEPEKEEDDPVESKKDGQDQLYA